MKNHQHVICHTVKILFIGILFCGMFFVREKKSFFFPKMLECKTDKKLLLARSLSVTQLHNTNNIVNEIPYNCFADIGDINHVKVKKFDPSWVQNISVSPVFDNNLIFVLKNTGHIQCYNKANNHLNWSYKIFPKIQKYDNPTLCIQGNKLTVTIKNNLFILDKFEGKEITYKNFDSPIVASAVIDKDQIVYIQTISHLHQHALKEKKEFIQFGSYKDIVQHNILSPILYKNGCITNYVDNKIIYTSSILSKEFGSETILLNLVSDLEIINTAYSSNKVCNVISQPIIDKDQLFIALSHNKIIKYNLTSKEKSWQVSIPGVSNISKVGNLLFCIGYANQLVCLDAISGKTNWVKTINYIDSSSFLTPIVVNDHVLLVSDSYKEAIFINAKTGDIKTKIQLKKFIRSDYIISSIVMNDKLLILTNKKAIYLH